MARSEKKKIRTLLVAKYFYENSDENHFIVASDIIDYLEEEHGIIADRRTIYRDIAVLRDEYDMDISGSQGGKYRLITREFSFDDLLLLAECVHAAKFISESKAKELIKTIGGFASTYEAEKLSSEVFLCDRIKTTRKDVLYNIGQINYAMSKQFEGKTHIPSKISFKYLKYTINNLKEQVERRKGEKYIVSPYKLLLNDGNYYLLAYSDKVQAMRTFRVDRMKSVDVLEEPREGQKEYNAIDISTYAQRNFSMFGGQQRRVRIRFINPLLDTAIERFGTGSSASYNADGKNHFIVSADVEISDPFFAWICSFRKGATILSPKDVVEDMQQFLSDIKDRYQ